MKRTFCGLLAGCLLFLLAGCTAPAEPAAPEDLLTATLCAVGDIYLTDDMLAAAAQPDGSYDFSAQFAEVIPAMSGADLTFGNLEGNLTAASYSQENASFPDTLADTLAAAGFDLLQTANTYSIHNGISGMQRTKSVLTERGMTPLGTFDNQSDRLANQVVVRDVNGIRIAFIAFTKGLGGLGMPDFNLDCVNLLYSDYTSNYEDINTTRIVSVIEAAKDTDPDLIVAALHWGSENVSEISSSQESIANLMVRNGVDVILGSHSHRVAQVERRTVTMDDDSEKEVLIAYGLGDFCAVSEGECNVSLMLELSLSKDPNTGKTTLGEAQYHAIAAVDRGKNARTRYTVLDVDSALALYESNYYDRVSDSLYEKLLSRREKLEKTVAPEEE